MDHTSTFLHASQADVDKYSADVPMVHDDRAKSSHRQRRHELDDAIDEPEANVEPHADVDKPKSPDEAMAGDGP